MPETQAHATIREKFYDEARGGWSVNVAIVTSNGDTRVGLEFLALPENATDAQLEAAAVALYE